ncbi:hypothetical protein ACQ7B2_15900, partial [Escherichia coli]
RVLVAARPFATAVGELPITVSVGAATGLGGADAPDPLIDAADAALLEAKRTGKNRVVVAGGHEPRAEAA